MKSIIRLQGKDRAVFTALALGSLVVATQFFATGCTSRKQYAINEAILISERRQLEDEIYRAKFELRDALCENERLRARLEKEGSGEEPAKRPDPIRTRESEMYPGGSSLNVGESRYAPAYRSSDPDAYDSSPTDDAEVLPDFVATPRDRYSRQELPMEKKTAIRPVGATIPSEREFGTRRPIARPVYDESPKAEKTRVDAPGFGAALEEAPAPVESSEPTSDASGWTPL